jgi:ferredoxin-NADP reductase
MFRVTIAAIHQATPTVKVFTLSTGSEQLPYYAGQWVDCYADIDGRREVGGYSLTSSPTTAGAVEIAVKQSPTHPVTRFLHERAAVADALDLSEGQGKCYFVAGMAPALMLIAGGIGITPLMSIVRYVWYTAPDVHITLIHSARTSDEHLFRVELEQMAAKNARLRCVFVESQPAAAAPPSRGGRIDRRLFHEIGIDPSALHFICGPGQMIDDLVTLLRTLGVDDTQLRFERWW